MLGDIYEYMLDKLSASGHNGQFRTPAQIKICRAEVTGKSGNFV